MMNLLCRKLGSSSSSSSAVVLSRRTPKRPWSRCSYYSRVAPTAATAAAATRRNLPTTTLAFYYRLESATTTTTRNPPNCKFVNKTNPWNRVFSTTAATTTTTQEYQSIRILYGSQGGTAKLFALQLAETLEEELGADDVTVTMQELNEAPPTELLLEVEKQQPPQKVLHVLLLSVTGVGEPPDNAREFYTWLMEQQEQPPRLQGIPYAVFGLGNSKAHPNHYNAIGKNVDKKLEELGATRVHPLGLGDDGECIEDAFDQWLEEFVQRLKSSPSYTSTETTTATAAATTTTPAEDVDMTTAATNSITDDKQKQDDDPSLLYVECLPGIAKNSTTNQRRISSKYPMVTLLLPTHDTIRTDLFGDATITNSIYAKDTRKLPVLSNYPLNPNPTESSLYELQISFTPALDNNNNTPYDYEAGDHLTIYPRNEQCIVDAYLKYMDINPHTIIEEPKEVGYSNNKYQYPLPTGITLSETLSHCVDLSAVPSPSFVKQILGKDVDYKNDIAMARKTVLDVLIQAEQQQQQQSSLSVEDILYNLVPMRPRYYSIASSPKTNPDKIYLLYRPVQYVTHQGNFRLGTCTHYMSQLVGSSGAGGTQKPSHILCRIVSNPTFRLPSALLRNNKKDTTHPPGAEEDPNKIPILLIAGGCGIAPIRSFLEERIYYAKQENIHYGLGYCFLGFRNPNDEVYNDLLQEALSCGAITHVYIAYNHGYNDDDDKKKKNSKNNITYAKGNITDAVQSHGEAVWDFLDTQGGYTYLCGGAKTFGVAIEKVVHQILETHGGMNPVEATHYLQQLHTEERFHEDFAD